MILKHTITSFVLKVCNVLSIYIFFGIYLASWSLSRGMWDLPHCIKQDLSMRHTESVVVMLAQ